MENNEKSSRLEWVDGRLNDLIRKPYLTDEECEELVSLYREFYEPRKRINIKLSITIGGNE